MSNLPDPTCGDCIAFSVETKDEKGVSYGKCRFRPEMKRIAESYPYCSSFKVRQDRAMSVAKAAPIRAKGQGRARQTAPIDAFHQKIATLKNPICGDTEGEISMDRDGLKEVLRELLQEETLYGYPQLGQKWHGGKLVMHPRNDELQGKELPLETFFNKIVMIRDRLRVLEAKINGHKTLENTEKVELQGYISKVYGTLTTFNALFAEKDDCFSSK